MCRPILRLALCLALVAPLPAISGEMASYQLVDPGPNARVIVRKGPSTDPIPPSADFTDEFKAVYEHPLSENAEIIPWIEARLATDVAP